MPTVALPDRDNPFHLTNVRKELIDLRILAAKDWDAAVDSLGPTATLSAILEHLQTMASGLAIASRKMIPILTEFQARQILAGFSNRLRLQHYVILDRLGSGGMGEVFLARNTNLYRLEAVKTVLHDPDAKPGSDKLHTLDRFEREARVLAALHHPYITTVYHAGREGNISFIAMEYVPGKNLKTIVEEAAERHEQVPLWWAAERISAVAEALQHAHENGVIHRDVKPNNIMITEDDELKVLDLGIARLLGRDGGASAASPRLTLNAMGLGTPEVMPPEQWADAGAVTVASDIYSLGCTFFYLLTGRMPFSATSLNELMVKHLEVPPPSVHTIRRDVPREVDAILRRMLAKKQEDRYASASDVVAALEPFTRDGSAIVATDRSETHIAFATAGVAILVAVAALAFSLWRREPGGQEPGGTQVAKVEPGTKPVVTPPADSSKSSQPTVDETTVPKDHPPKPEEEPAKKVEPQETKGSPPATRPKEPKEDSREEKPAKAPEKSTASPNETSPSKMTPPADKEKPSVKETPPAKETAPPKMTPPVVSKVVSKAEPTVVAGKMEKTSKGMEEPPTKTTTEPPTLEPTPVAKRKEAFEGLVRSLEKEVDEKLGPSAQELATMVQERRPLLRGIDDAGFEDLQISFRRDFWGRRSEYWLADFQKLHPLTWPAERDLTAFVGERFQDGVLGRRMFEAVQQTVRLETEKRIKEWPRAWLARYQGEHSDLWPDLKVLEQAALRGDAGPVPAEEKGLRGWMERVEKLSAAMQAPFVDRKRLQTGDAELDARLNLFADRMQWLVQVQSGKQPASGKVDLQILVDGKAVSTIPVKAQAEIRMRTTQRGYVCLLVYQQDEGLTLLRWGEPLDVGTYRTLLRTSGDRPGADKVAVYLTEAGPPDKRRPQPGENGPIPGVDGSLNDLFTLQVDVAELQLIRKSFRYEFQFDSVMRHLGQGRSYPFASPADVPGFWTRDDFEIRVQ